MADISSSWAPNDAFDVPEPMRAAYPALQEALTGAAAVARDPSRGGLPLRIREIVSVAVIAYLGYPGIGVHMRRALDAGSSIREIAEALITICTPGGQRCLAFALPELTALVEERGEIAHQTTSAPVSARTDRTLTPSGDWAWLDDRFPDYQVARRELSRLAFVPRNATLETKYREILVMAVLACRRYFTVIDHARRAVEEGATLEEMIDAMYVASLFGGAGVFSFMLPCLGQIREEIEAGTLHPR
jgi:alkylhydroperoxidase/carboxymuconolactone decarboxylase family protein YurZ